MASHGTCAVDRLRAACRTCAAPAAPAGPQPHPADLPGRLECCLCRRGTPGGSAATGAARTCVKKHGRLSPDYEGTPALTGVIMDGVRRRSGDA